MSCEPVGDRLLESRLNPNCGLDIYETCNEDTWVKCKIAENRLSRYVISAVIVLIMILVFIFGTTGVKLIVGIVGALMLGAVYASQVWVGASARVEYQRFERELKGLEARGVDRKTAMKMHQEEVLSREKTSALRSQSPNSSFVNTAIGVGMGYGLGLLSKSTK